jgi:hypothetical protein
VDLWPLIDALYAKADKVRADFSSYGETTMTGHRLAGAYEDCAEQLIELAGPRCFA